MFAIGRRRRQPQQVPAPSALEHVVHDTSVIIVEMYTPGRRWRESFTGRWTDAGSLVDDTFAETGLVWRVGVTATGRLVAYRGLMANTADSAKAHVESLLLTFATPDEFRDGVVPAGFPASCVDTALKYMDYAIVRHHTAW